MKLRSFTYTCSSGSRMLTLSQLQYIFVMLTYTILCHSDFHIPMQHNYHAIPPLHMLIYTATLPRVLKPLHSPTPRKGEWPCVIVSRGVALPSPDLTSTTLATPRRALWPWTESRYSTWPSDLFLALLSPYLGHVLATKVPWTSPLSQTPEHEFNDLLLSDL